MNTKTSLFFTLCICLFVSGCRFSPFSPELRNRIDNQNGKIEDIKNNQNGLMLELGKLRQDAQITAEEIKNFQQGIVNLKGQENNGIQIFSGDVGFITVIGMITISIILIYHYRKKAAHAEKTANILAQQITAFNSEELSNNVFLSALNTEVENEIYHVMIKNQKPKI